MTWFALLITAPPRYEDCFFAASGGMKENLTAGSSFTPRYVTFTRTATDIDDSLSDE